MGYSRFDNANRERAAWNAGKKAGIKRPFTQKQVWAIRFLLDRERRIRTRALFDRQSTASFAAATWSRLGSVMWSPVRRSGLARSSCSRRRGGRSSSRSPATYERACLPGWNGAAAPLRIMSFRALSRRAPLLL